jgi:hypothetical protein
MALIDDLQAWKLNKDLKADFENATQNAIKAAWSFVVGVVSGGSPHALEHVMGLDNDPDDKERNVTAYRVGVITRPLAAPWINVWLGKNLPGIMLAK